MYREDDEYLIEQAYYDAMMRQAYETDAMEQQWQQTLEEIFAVEIYEAENHDRLTLVEGSD